MKANDRFFVLTIFFIQIQHLNLISEISLPIENLKGLRTDGYENDYDAW